MRYWTNVCLAFQDLRKNGVNETTAKQLLPYAKKRCPYFRRFATIRTINAELKLLSQIGYMRALENGTYTAGPLFHQLVPKENPL